MITHSVFFSLVHPQHSPQEHSFLRRSFEILTQIPGVQNFSVLSQTSPKCDFCFGFSMQFASQADYDFYNSHPTHVTYVQEIWLNEVASFQEIDFISHPHPDFSTN